MANIYFLCKNCKTSLGVAEENAGSEINCPVCDTSVLIPVPDMQWKCHCGEEMAASTDMSGETFECMQCAQKVKAPSRLQLKKNNVKAEDEDRKKEVLPFSCATCGSLNQTNASICRGCGLNFKTGKKLRSQTISDKKSAYKFIVLILLILLAAGGVFGWHKYPDSKPVSFVKTLFQKLPGSSASLSCLSCNGQGICRNCNGRRSMTCDGCNGSGLGEMRTESRSCVRCKGSGSVKLIKGVAQCPDCKGSGRKPYQTRAMCEKCKGHKFLNCVYCNGIGRCQDCKK